MKDLAFVALLFLAASFLAHCGPVDPSPGVDGASPDAGISVCYAPSDPFRAFPCDADGVTCACPDCYVADAGEGTCKP